MFFLNYATVIDPLLRDIRAYILEFSEMKSGDRVLDICCGTGDQAMHYARRGMVATGVDLDPGMIKLAEKSKRKHGLENVSFKIADAVNLPFLDGFFDCASISFALHEQEVVARNKTIAEMKRVVKKGGGLIFSDFLIPLPSKFYTCLVSTVEFLASRQQYKCFKDYVQQGGLEAILKQNQIVEDKRGRPNRFTIVIKAGNQ